MPVRPYGIMKSGRDGKKQRELGDGRRQISHTSVAIVMAQGAKRLSPKKQRSNDVIDRDYRIWREELL
jgi:hypothetical protein